MSTAHIAEQIKAVRARAESTSNVGYGEIQQIDKDPNLSDTYRKQLRGEKAAAVKERLAALRDEEKSIITRAITEAERTLDSKVGGSGADLIAFRDAQDRAERLQDQDSARQMLARALRNDDHTLAHAVFRRGVDTGWQDVINLFKQENPNSASAATDLQNLQEELSNGMSRAMHYAFLV